MEELVFKGENNQALTNSLLVAEKFGKEHSDVLKAIESIASKMTENQCKGYFSDTSIEVQQPNGGVRHSRVVAMNRDGFTLLVMGFTGKKALQFKIDYIAAFNAMEATIREQQKPLSAVQMFALQANINLEHEQRLSSVEQKLEALTKEREENSMQLLSVSISGEFVPELSLRDKVRQLVNRYASASNISQRDVWHKIYDQLYYLYHISVKAYKRDKKETNLDVAERNGFIDKIHIIISNMIREKRQTA